MALKRITSHPDASHSYNFGILKWLLFAPFAAMFLLPYFVYQGRVRVRQIIDGQEILQTYDHPTVIAALALVVLWLAGAIAFAMLIRALVTFKSTPTLPSLPADLRVKTFFFLSATGAISFVIHSLVYFPSAVENIVHLLSLLTGVSITLACALIASPEVSKQKKWLILVLASLVYFLICLLPLLAGKAYGAAIAFFLLVGSLISVRAPIKLMTPLIAVALFLTLFSMIAKTPIRESLDDRALARVPWNQSTQVLQRGSFSFFSKDQLERDLSAFRDFDQNNDLALPKPEWMSESIYQSALRITHRLNHLGLLTLVMQETPERVAHTGLITYQPLFFSFIPRALYPGKPTSSFANEFGRQYRVISEDDNKTSINFDPVTQAWSAGGLLGVMLSSAVFGCIIGLTYQWLTSGGEQWTRLYIFSAALLAIPGLEFDLSLSLGGFIQSLILAFAALLFTRWLAKRSRVASTFAPT